MNDLDVMTRAMKYAAAVTTSRGADQACKESADPFNGSELLAGCLGVPRDTVTALLAAHTKPIPVVEAIRRRGAILVNGAGRVGIVITADRVVEPAGRQFALTTTTAEWWTAGYWGDDVVTTVPA